MSYDTQGAIRLRLWENSETVKNMGWNLMCTVMSTLNAMNLETFMLHQIIRILIHFNRCVYATVLFLGYLELEH